MTSSNPPARTRHWTDFLAILTGVALLALAVWPRPATISEEASQELGSPEYAWIAWIIGGASALAAVFLAQRARRPALFRGLMLLGGVVLLVGFIVSRASMGANGWLTLMLPAVVLFACAFGIGPMPRQVDRA